MRRGVFQSNPILETFLSYYTSSSILESVPHEDPGVRNQPLGILALVTAGVCQYATFTTTALTRPWGRLNVHTRCMLRAISLSLASHLAVIPGVQQLCNLWIILPMTSPRGIGIQFLVCSIPFLHKLQRRRRCTMAFHMSYHWGQRGCYLGGKLRVY